MHIALIEPVMTGHRPTYLRYYIRSFLNKGHNVTVFCPDDSGIQKECYQPYDGNLAFIDYRLYKKKYSRFSMPRNALHQWRRFSEKAEEATGTIDITFFMSLDTFHVFFFKNLNILGMPLHFLLNRTVPHLIDRIQKSNWAGIFLTPTPDYSQMFQSKKNIAIGVLEESLQFANDKLNRKIIGIPDITNTELSDEKSGLEKEILEKAAGRKIICLPGRIHKRKSVITLLDAANELKNEDYFFVIAGEPAMDSFSDAEKNRLERREGENYFLYPERIEDGHEFNSLIRASSLIFASYINFPHSSNMLTKCAYFKKPIIVTENTYMADVVTKYNMGLTIRQKSVSDTVKAVKKLANSFDSSEAEFQAYYEQHKVGRIDDVIDELIQLHGESQ